MFVLQAMYKKDGMLKYPKVFHCDNGYGLDVTKLIEKQNVDV